MIFRSVVGAYNYKAFSSPFGNNDYYDDEHNASLDVDIIAPDNASILESSTVFEKIDKPPIASS